jgi:pimeloyl-ACP methyl ester carboxylesterase
VPPNLTEPTELTAHSFLDCPVLAPGNPDGVGIWTAMLDSMVEQYPEADGYWVWLAELYFHSEDQATRDIIARYDHLRPLIPGKAEIMAMGHSYASGMAVYLASQRPCSKLVVIAGYRDVSDLYNKMIPIFWGPFKYFITNNIKTKDYAPGVDKTLIITSDGDRTLSRKLQYKLAPYFKDSEVKEFPGIAHTDYLFKDEVVSFIESFLRQS